MTRDEFDSFLQLYGIPSTDEKYSQYKKSQTSALVNEQFNKLASEMKHPLSKPSYPDTIIGEDNTERFKKYNNKLDAYNKQQQDIKQGQTEVLKTIKQGFKDKMAYYNQQEKKEQESKHNMRRPMPGGVNQQIQKSLEQVNNKLNHLTKDEQYEKQQYEKFQQQQRDKASGKIPKSTPDIRAPIITNNHVVRPKQPSNPPVVKKPNKIPNTHRHINHNIMSFQEYKNIMLEQGFGIGQAEYKDYLRQFHLNDPSDYLKGQLEVKAKERGSNSLAKGHSIEQHQQDHSKNIVNHISNNNIAPPGQISKVSQPQVIKLHNFTNPIPTVHSHEVKSHSIIKQAGKEAGNPNNPPPKIVSGPRQDNHINPIGAIVSAGAQGGSASSIMGAATEGAQVGSRMANEMAQYAKFQQQQAAGGKGTEIRALQN